MKSKLNQLGIAPIILIIIFTIVITGVAGVAYKSRKEIKVRSDKTTEVRELKGTPAPEPKKQEVELANSGRLADKPFEKELAVVDEATNSAVPKFSIYPPAGWEKLPPKNNIVVEFLSSAEDKVEEETAWLTIQPNITVNVMKVEYTNLDDTMQASLSNRTNPNHTILNKKKAKINGEDVYVIESVMDIRETAQGILKSQIQQEIARVAKEEKRKVSTEYFQKDIDKVLEKAKLKILSYAFFKDGYYITVAGKSFESFWDKREVQIKRSMDTFKFVE